MTTQLQEIIVSTLPNPSKFRIRHNYCTVYVHDLHLAITEIDGRFQFSITKSYPGSLQSYQYYASTCFDLIQLEDEFKAMRARLEARGLLPA